MTVKCHPTQTFVVAAALLASVGAAPAQAACKHLEFAELQRMSRSDLEFEYCIAKLEAAKAQIAQRGANDQNALEGSRAWGPDSRNVARNDRAAERASDAYDSCVDEQVRIGKIIEKKKGNLQALDEKCTPKLRSRS